MHVCAIVRARARQRSTTIRRSSRNGAGRQIAARAAPSSMINSCYVVANAAARAMAAAIGAHDARRPWLDADVAGVPRRELSELRARHDVVAILG